MVQLPIKVRTNHVYKWYTKYTKLIMRKKFDLLNLNVVYIYINRIYVAQTINF